MPLCAARCCYFAALVLGIPCLAAPLLAAGEVVGGAGFEETVWGLNTDINEAAKNGDTERVRQALQESSAATNYRDKEGLTPLHEAAGFGQVEVATLLLKANADVNAINNKGLTPLHMAASAGQAGMVSLLLAHKANVALKAIDGSTPLHSAASHGHTEVVSLLLANGSDIHGETSRGLTALHLAALLDHPDVAKVLLAHGADVNARAGSRSGSATGAGAHVASTLLGQGFTVLQGDHYAKGATPLHLATLMGCVDVAKLLLENKADVNAQDDSGKTPLRIAKHGSSIAQLLRQHGGHD